MKLLLGNKEYLNAVNKDYYFNIEFNNSQLIYQNESIIKIIDELNQFTLERNLCKDYILYGKIETFRDEIISDDYLLNNDNYNISVGYIEKYVPLLNNSVNITNISNGYVEVSSDSFFINDIIMSSPDNKIRRVIEKPTPTTLLLDTIDGLNLGSQLIPSISRYQRVYKNILDINFINTYNSGYGINIFNDPLFQYHTYQNINVKDLNDNLNYPIRTLLFNFKSKKNTTRRFKSNNSTILNDINIIDSIELNLNDLTYTILDNVQDEFLIDNIMFYYKPYYEIPIKSLSSVIVDIKGSDYEDEKDYGFKFNNDDIVYREILDLGFFENEIGMDYPFMNNVHYVYSDIKFPIRRKSPIAQYIDNPLDNVYNTSIINSNVGLKRLC